VAPKLVVGGMPRSNLPMLLSLLALTAGLVVAALLQLRREYELARLRGDFVSGVSHELRTPLAQIRMFSETLLLGRVRSDEEQVLSLEIIDQEARRLTHLVENLLHFSRSERQLTRLSPAPAPLAPLVSEAAEGFAPLAAARGVTLRTELADGVVAIVNASWTSSGASSGTGARPWRARASACPSSASSWHCTAVAPGPRTRPAR